MPTASGILYAAHTPHGTAGTEQEPDTVNIPDFSADLLCPERAGAIAPWQASAAQLFRPVIFLISQV